MVFRNHRALAMMVLFAVPAVCVSSSFGQDAAPGVVRISDHQPAIIPAQHQTYRTASPQEVLQTSWNAYGTAGCDVCNGGNRSFFSRMFRRGSDDCEVCKPRRRRVQGFGFGAYDITYAVNPYYQDPRDTRVYSAQGWGVPMGVPLAPTVTNTYNYGWGIPSSRMTPISRPVRP